MIQIGVNYELLRAPSLDVQFLANYLIAPAAHNGSLEFGTRGDSRDDYF
jgi:hypothetical protein